MVTMTLGNLETCSSSITPKIKFIHVQEQYSFTEDLICKYSLNDYDVREDDRIAIFKLGWQHVKECILFEWVPKYYDKNVVIFNKLCLPRDTNEIYQFCFISGENDINGASTPFQFCDKPKNCQSLISLPKKEMHLSVDNCKTSGADKDAEILKLKKENNFLNNMLQYIVINQKDNNSSSDVQILQKIMFDLQSAMHIQQLQINELKLKVSYCTKDYKTLKQENLDLQNTCKTLKEKLGHQINYLKTAIDFDIIEEFESMPPLPLKQ